MKRRGFLKALLAAPIAGLAVCLPSKVKPKITVEIRDATMAERVDIHQIIGKLSDNNAILTDMVYRAQEDQQFIKGMSERFHSSVFNDNKL